MMTVTKDIGLAYHFLKQHKGERFTAEQVAAGAGIKLAAAQRVGMLLAELRIFDVRLNPHPRRYELHVPPIDENIPRIHAIEDELQKVILPDLRRATAQAKAKEDLASKAGEYPAHQPMPDRRSTSRKPDDAATAPEGSKPGPGPNGGGRTQDQNNTGSAPDTGATRGSGSGSKTGAESPMGAKEAVEHSGESPAASGTKQNEAGADADPNPAADGMDGPTFTFSPGAASARALEIDRGFLVLAGSTAKSLTTPTFPSGSMELRTQLLSEGILVQSADSEVLTFVTDYVFTSSSAAASIVAGRSASGPLEWKHANTGQNYRDWAGGKTNRAAL